MSSILDKWDQTNEKLYETGTDRVVLYKKITTATTGYAIGDYGPGKPWNGFTGLSESPSGAEETALWANNNKYLSLYSREEFSGTLKAYTYPPEWEECDGSATLSDDNNNPIPGVTVAQQTRTGFGLSYRTRVGNDTKYDDYGYKIHLVYGATASPSSKDYQTINDSPEAIEFSWDFKTVPVDVPKAKPTSCLTIDATKLEDYQVAALEAVLYGTENDEPKLPLPAEVISIISNATAPVGEPGLTGSAGSTGN